MVFPFLFGGTFIEAYIYISYMGAAQSFPFLFGGTFIEAGTLYGLVSHRRIFPFLFGGTFIEALNNEWRLEGALTISLPFRRDFH